MNSGRAVNTAVVESARSRLRELERMRDLSSRRHADESLQSAAAQEKQSKEIIKLSADLIETTQAAAVIEDALEEERERVKQLERRLRSLEEQSANLRKGDKASHQKQTAVVSGEAQSQPSQAAPTAAPFFASQEAIQRLQREMEERVAGAERDAESERAMRRSLEAKYEEKLKLRAREIEGLEQEVRRLKRAGDQLPPVLQELDRIKLDADERAKSKDSELRRVTAAFNATEAERSKLELQLSRQLEEMANWEARVKKAEEIRYGLRMLGLAFVILSDY